MIEYYEALVAAFDFAAPYTASGRACVYTRTSLGIWIGRRRPLYAVAARPLLLSSEYDGIAHITRSTSKPFIWLTPERRFVVADGSRLIYTELKILLRQSLSDDETRWLDMGLRQDIGAITGECARLHQTVDVESPTS